MSYIVHIYILYVHVFFFILESENISGRCEKLFLDIEFVETMRHFVGNDLFKTQPYCNHNQFVTIWTHSHLKRSLSYNIKMHFLL